MLQEIAHAGVCGTVEPDPLEVIETNEIIRQLKKKLSENHQQALDLLLENDFKTQTEFAEAVGWSKSSVSKFLNQVRIILEELLYQ